MVKREKLNTFQTDKSIKYRIYPFIGSFQLYADSVLERCPRFYKKHQPNIQNLKLLNYQASFDIRQLPLSSFPIE